MVGRKNVIDRNYNDKLFYCKESEDYGLKNYGNIILYALRRKLDLDEACREYNLTREESDLVKLMYARDLYKNGLIKFGNIYFNNVEKLADKSPVVTEFMSEIQRKKRFYQHRPTEKPKVLGLVKVNKKNKYID
jgi:hypothetical protein